MSTATVRTYTIVGVTPVPVAVTAYPTRWTGAPLALVDMPAAAARETRVRVRSALLSVGIDLSEHTVTIAMDPAPASGGGCDLAIALAVLAALDTVPAAALDDTVVLGELSLTGQTRHTRGVAPMLRAATAAGVPRALVPAANAAEASRIQGIETRASAYLTELASHLRYGRTAPGHDAPPLTPLSPPPVAAPDASPPAGGDCDLSDLRRPHVARALEVAAAGGHHVLLVGPSGCGKTLAARRLVTLLPELTAEERAAVTDVQSAAGLLPAAGEAAGRPFRAPHHTVSPAALVGGGDPIRPGEVSLAHGGVLLLDDLSAYRTAALEAVRRAVVLGHVTATRARTRATLPARCLLVGSMTPCACGKEQAACTCPPGRAAAYRARTSVLRPLFDVVVPMRPITTAEVLAAPKTESSTTVRARVTAARAAGSLTTAPAARPRYPVALDGDATLLLGDAVRRLGLGPDDTDRIRRVARTIAILDTLDAHAAVRPHHLAEALVLAAPAAHAERAEAVPS